MVDTTRRDAIKQIIKGTAYVSPVVYTISAPVRLAAQGGSGTMMWMLCDWFPIICMWFGESQAVPAPPGQQLLPDQDLQFPPVPGNPPPGGRGPWEVS